MSQPEKSPVQVLLFVGVILVISSLALSLASEGLRARKEANEKLDKQRNILKAFNVDLGATPTAEGVEAAYAKVESVVVDHRGAKIEDAQIVELDKTKPLEDQYKLLLRRAKGLAVSEEQIAGFQLPVYLLRSDDGAVSAYALPIVGDGLWGRMFGYISLEKDLNTVLGITFYSHKETPGLGAEITEAWFQQNFAGKKIQDAAGALRSVAVTKGRAADKFKEPDLQHYVDGISGATITSDGVTAMIRLYLDAYGSYFDQIRKGDS